MNVFDVLREKLKEKSELYRIEEEIQKSNPCYQTGVYGFKATGYEDAIEIVNQAEKEYHEYIENYTGKGTFNSKEIRLIELEAFEKQIIAMKPCNKNGLYHCPKCKMPIFSSTNHCSDCGQKLKWD